MRLLLQQDFDTRYQVPSYLWQIKPIIQYQDIITKIVVVESLNGNLVTEMSITVTLFCLIVGGINLQVLGKNSQVHLIIIRE